MRKTEQNKLNKTRAHHAYNAQQTGENGITLVALVITIIVLLILAGVAINMAINSDGLFAKANEATEEWNTAVGQEETTINNLIDTLEEFSPSLKPMITKWNIAAGDEISMFLYSQFAIDFDEEGNPVGKELSNNTDVIIDWGDGTVEHYTSDNLIYDDMFGIVEHTYEIANSNTKVTINGKCNTIAVPGINQLTAIEQWGYTETTGYSFFQCTNLSSIASPEKYTFKNVKYFGAGEAPAFAYCTSLTNIPDYMFAHCTSIKNFAGAFAGCTNLTSIGAHAFDGCTNVTSFARAFEGCTGITSIGDCSFANCSAVTEFWYLFSYNTSLTSVGAHAFDGCANVTRFDGLFCGCTNLTSIGAHVFDSCTNVTSFARAFEGCAGITSIGDYAFANCTSVTSFAGLFSDCTNLTSIGDYAFANCTAVTDFEETFSGCTSLQSIPEHLFENTPSVESFICTFRYCTSLTGNPIPLWERVEDGANNGYCGVPDGRGCYNHCTGLTDYEAIPEYWHVYPE